MTNNNHESIIVFWYSDRSRKHWFNSTPAFDEELRTRFEQVYTSAAKHQLNDWQTTAIGALALVILLDQIPLNIFRGKPESFATEANARTIAQYAIDNKLDIQLTDEQKLFLYMPFMHSEYLPDQHTAIALFEKAGLHDNARYAHHHCDIVKRFGRFPHRNKILGRNSTQAELAYLASDEAFLG